MAHRQELPAPSTEQKWTSKPRGPLWKRAFRWTLWGTGMLTAGLAAFLVYAWLVPLPQVPVYQTTTIYSADGAPLYNLHNQGVHRRIIPLSEMPPLLIEATLAVEDRAFYRHFGLDPKGILRAAWVDLKNRDLSQGASTITQQLARNLYLSHDKTWRRKLMEAVYAVRMEMQWSKDDILAMYLNHIYYGESAYGIQAAAETYFGKNARDLTPAEVTLLVGIPKSPSRYSPFRDLEAAKQRQQVVLEAMVAAGVITPEEKQRIAAMPVQIKADQPAKTDAPYFLDYVLREAQERYAIEPGLLYNGGLHISTTLDPHIQQAAEAAVRRWMPENSPLQVALVAIEPSTGALRALVGGRDYRTSQYNRALALRQPGSSFKPFLYLAALENGWTAATLQMSEPTVFTFASQTYRPRNFGDQYPNRPITMREAIRTSDNIYAVKTHLQLGPEKLMETARRLGIDSPLKAVPSLALGSMEVTPLDMAKAYAAIAGGGKQAGVTAIIQIADAKGRILAQASPVRKAVTSPQAAFVLTNMLQAPFEPGGTAYRVRHRLSRPVAGKTGTTDTDAWMVGFTPQLAAAVWVGYDQPQKLTTAESRLAAVIWADFMEQALADQPVETFPVPEGVVQAYIDPQTGHLATPHCPTVTLEVFIAGTEPTETCSIHPGRIPPADPTTPEEPRSLWQRLWDWFR